MNELLVLEEEDTSETQEDVLKGDLGLSEIDGDTLISSSTKVTALMNHIQHVLENNKGDKILIVSQWTRFATFFFLPSPPSKGNTDFT